MGNWYVNLNIDSANGSAVYDGQNIPIFLNKTGHAVKITEAYIAGAISADSTHYYMLYLRDNANNNIFTKDMYNVALATGAVSMGSVVTAYQVIEDDETVHLQLTKAGSGCTMTGMHIRLEGEFLRGG